MVLTPPVSSPLLQTKLTQTQQQQQEFIIRPPYPQTQDHQQNSSIQPSPQTISHLSQASRPDTQLALQTYPSQQGAAKA